MTTDELLSMDIDDLRNTRLRLVVELWVVEREIISRMHADYRKRRPKGKLTEDDLFDRAPSSKASMISATLKQLTPEELARVREALRSREKTK